MNRQIRFGDLVFALFILVQILDGVLTYMGVLHFDAGVEVEGNPLLRIAMLALGVRTALLIVKVAAMLFGWFIYFHRYHKVLATLTAFYAVAAIFPWAVLLWGLYAS